MAAHECLVECARIKVPARAALLGGVARGLLVEVRLPRAFELVDEDRDGVAVVVRGIDLGDASDRDSAVNRGPFEIRLRAAASERALGVDLRSTHRGRGVARRLLGRALGVELGAVLVDRFLFVDLPSELQF
jgi:GNAT superfamily N-acetyltransferase